MNSMFTAIADWLLARTRIERRVELVAETTEASAPTYREPAAVTETRTEVVLVSDMPMMRRLKIALRFALMVSFVVTLGLWLWGLIAGQAPIATATDRALTLFITFVWTFGTAFMLTHSTRPVWVSVLFWTTLGILVGNMQTTWYLLVIIITFGLVWGAILGHHAATDCKKFQNAGFMYFVAWFAGATMFHRTNMDTVTTLLSGIAAFLLPVAVSYVITALICRWRETKRQAQQARTKPCQRLVNTFERSRII